MISLQSQLESLQSQLKPRDSYMSLFTSKKLRTQLSGGNMSNLSSLSGILTTQGKFTAKQLHKWLWLHYLWNMYKSVSNIHQLCLEEWHCSIQILGTAAGSYRAYQLSKWAPGLHNCRALPCKDILNRVQVVVMNFWNYTKPLHCHSSINTNVRVQIEIMWSK